MLCPSAVDDAAQLTQRVLRRRHQPLLQLNRDLMERAVVGQAPCLELPVAPADEYVRWLGEIPDHFVDQPCRLPGPQRTAPGEMGDQLLEGPLRTCHTGQHARSADRMATTLPEIGQDFTYEPPQKLDSVPSWAAGALPGRLPEDRHSQPVGGQQRQFDLQVVGVHGTAETFLRLADPVLDGVLV